MARWDHLVITRYPRIIETVVIYEIWGWMTIERNKLRKDIEMMMIKYKYSNTKLASISWTRLVLWLWWWNNWKDWSPDGLMDGRVAWIFIPVHWVLESCWKILPVNNPSLVSISVTCNWLIIVWRNEWILNWAELLRIKTQLSISRQPLQRTGKRKTG